MTSDIPKEVAPRLCHIIRWSDFQGYGFNLHAEKGKAGQFIGKVDEGSPAEASGLKEGDRIVEVNGVNIGNENHQQVVTRIRTGGEETRLLVVDSSSDDWFKDNKLVIKGDISGIIFGTARRDVPEEEPQQETEPEPEQEPERVPTPEPEPEIEAVSAVAVEAEAPPPPVTNGNNGYSDDDVHKPRLCHLRLWPHFQGYGFNLHAERDKPGQYIGLVDDNSPASTAGLKVNDRIVEVNGKNIEKEPHATVIGYIKETPGEARMLVLDPQADNYYREKGTMVHSSMSQVEYIATPENPDSAAQLEAVEDLDNLPPPPPPAEEEAVYTEPEPIEYTEPTEEVSNGEAVDAVDAILAQQDDDQEEEEDKKEEEEEEEEEVATIPEPIVEPEPEPEPVSMLPEPVADPEPEPAVVEETVNGVKAQEAPSPPEPEFTVAKEPEPEPVVAASKPAPAPVPEPAKAAPPPAAPAPASKPEDDGLMLNLSVAEMKERLKAKKKADPRQSKISFERKHQQFERM